jgi:glycosyltransferase involved in cell wall biosynthesis
MSWLYRARRYPRSQSQPSGIELVVPRQLAALEERAVQSEKSRVLMVVLNDIVRDGRVLKSAAAAAAAGLDVTVLGRVPNTDPDQTRQEARVGDVTIVRVPVSLVLTSEGPRSPAPVRLRHAISSALGFRNQQAFLYATHLRKRRERTWRTLAAKARNEGGTTISTRMRSRFYGELIRADHRIWDARRRIFAAPRREPKWSELLTTIADFDYAFSAEIERHKPDLIHAHDFTAIAIVGASVQRMRAAGHPVRWLYDAHEYVPGIALPSRSMIRAYTEMEREWIHDADAVITVGPLLAEEMSTNLGLPQTPQIVLNCPLEASFGAASEPSIRDAIGLSSNERLIVYSGGVSKARGVDTVVRALPYLPDHHFAIVVADTTTPVMSDLLDLAIELGVSDRVHTAPFVPQHEITTYLSTADIAAHTLTHWGNHEVALPNKLFEYIHAGLPIAVSDVQAMSEFVQKEGIGKVFVSEDARSFAEAIRAIEADYDRLLKSVRRPALRGQYRWETQSATLLSVYGKLLGRDLSVPSGDSISRELGTVDKCVLGLEQDSAAEPSTNAQSETP